MQAVPSDYEVNGESLVPFLFTDKPKHRDWIYGYNGADQIIRGDLVMKDGKGKWWDVSAEPDDLISFPEIKDWNLVSDAHRNERDALLAVLPKFNLHETEHDAPGVVLPAMPAKPKQNAKPGKKVDPSVRTEPKASSNAGERKLLFADNFDGRTLPGDELHDRSRDGRSVDDSRRRTLWAANQRRPWCSHSQTHEVQGHRHRV